MSWGGVGGAVMYDPTPLNVDAPYSGVETSKFEV